MALVALGLAGLAFHSYRRPLVPLSPTRRSALIALRALALIAVLLFACRPVILLPPANAGDVVVPVLVDVSRSMRTADADGGTRIAQAQRLVTLELLPALSRIGKPELFRVGEALTKTSPDNLAADGRRTDLSGAIAAVRDRFRGRRVAGIIILSDGGDTGQSAASVTGRTGAPVFAVGIGSLQGPPGYGVFAS